MELWARADEYVLVTIFLMPRNNSVRVLSVESVYETKQH